MQKGLRLFDWPSSPALLEGNKHIFSYVRTIWEKIMSLLVFVQDMRTCIETFCRQPEHRTMDSCVVCLLSHGVEGAIYGTDGQLLQVWYAVLVYFILFNGKTGLILTFKEINMEYLIIFSWTGCLRLLTTRTVHCSKTNQRCFSFRPAEEVRDDSAVNIKSTL